ncbi:hypothetical protein DFH06DRAFT_1225204 [Mycena polygramma]|nr:hypothetical protein DFH06DRAFT_1225204 [Mycena polygramma]
MQRTRPTSFTSTSRPASLIIDLQTLRLRFLMFIPIIILWLPARCMALELGAPRPEDTMSMTIFSGGALSLSWNVNASDPQLFDLALVGGSDSPSIFPGIRSTDSPLKLLVNSSPQNYFFRATDNTTGVTLAESGMFEVTSKPRMMHTSSSMSLSGNDSSPSATTDVLAQSQTSATQPRTNMKIGRGSFIGAIVGSIVGTAVIFAALVWWYCARRRRRAAPRDRPMLIDDDALSKVGSEAPSLPAYAYPSPFPMPTTASRPTLSPPPAASRPRLSPLRLATLQAMSERPSRHRQSSSDERPPSGYRKTSSYYPSNTRSPGVHYAAVRNPTSPVTSPTSRRPAVRYQPVRNPTSRATSPVSAPRASASYGRSSPRNPASRATSPVSDPRTGRSSPRNPPSRATSPRPTPHVSTKYRPVSSPRLMSPVTSTAASTHPPGLSYKPASYQHARESHHRKLSHDVPPSSPLSKVALTPERRASYFLDERPARRASTLLPSAAERLETQVELETALSETVYDNAEDAATPGNLKAPPSRRRELRCTSEPRLSSEVGSADGHELQQMLREEEIDDPENTSMATATR